MTPVTNIENLHETIFVKLYNNNLFYLAEMTILKTVCVHYLHTPISLQSAVKKITVSVTSGFRRCLNTSL